jgi:hypothetical protein
VMRTNVLLNGETPFRRAYIRSAIDQVEVDDEEIRIVGRLKGLLYSGRRPIHARIAMMF